jgi:hypothetical protein
MERRQKEESGRTKPEVHVSAVPGIGKRNGEIGRGKEKY